MSRFTARLRGLFVRGRMERELEDEPRFHLEIQTGDNLRAGMDLVEGRYAAMRSFGGADRMKEQRRDWRAFAAVETMDVQIAGVVQDARSHSLRDRGAPAVYVPSVERLASGVNFDVHAGGSMAQVVSELRREIHPLHIRTLTEDVERTLVATLAGSFGTLALILASIGLYGLLAYAVARRVNEIGIRMALGVARAHVLRMVIRDALRLLGLGVALGLPAVWAASQSVSSMLFGLTPTDPMTILAATAFLTLFGLLAGFLPALQASRVDPMVALRYE